MKHLLHLFSISLKFLFYFLSPSFLRFVVHFHFLELNTKFIYFSIFFLQLTLKQYIPLVIFFFHTTSFDRVFLLFNSKYFIIFIEISYVTHEKITLFPRQQCNKARALGLSFIAISQQFQII